eukprot:CAMPEP_0170248606 /NCGR_PEP_ID=MMETSP0116_2-20130129/24098_1 /TAXON_ID=400756 /ORGANISM="Durinskia baltica, Strain CSIRO CS-38" /LENGTH=101 /DNA_ID=CAMNT_0010499499 /DNA_START=700 /DNA_END=1003 /DNA_ORIENTATION=+
MICSRFKFILMWSMWTTCGSEVSTTGFTALTRCLWISWCLAWARSAQVLLATGIARYMTPPSARAAPVSLAAAPLPNAAGKHGSGATADPPRGASIKRAHE